MKRQRMNQKRVKYSIGIISILLHLLVLIILLLIYHTPAPDFSYLQSFVEPASTTPETVFYEPDMETFPDDSAWAELKPRSSILGPSMDLIEDSSPLDNHVLSETQNALESFDMLRTSGKEIIEQNFFDNPVNKTELNIENSISTTAESLDPLVLTLRPGSGVNVVPPVVSTVEPSKDSSAQKSTKQKNPIDSKKSDAQIKKIQAQQALAGIMSGYLEQLQNEGENLIKTIGGDPNKKPTAEQIKYERYLAKIQWCLQNAHNINQDKCLNHEPVQAKLTLFFTLDRLGKMSNLRIMQSSGNNFVDTYILSLFNSASSSFPPLPSYIKEDPYSLFYTVLVNWGMKESSYMGFARN